jgi:hypothetical protein
MVFHCLNLLDSGFRRNDVMNKALLLLVTPAKAGVLFEIDKRKGFQTMMSRQ